MRTFVLSLTAVAALATGALLSGCDATSGPNATSDDHHYATKSGEAYGYEFGLTEEDKQAGRRVSELKMYRYAGESAGEYRIVAGDHDDPVVFSCEKPCKFIKVREVGSTGDPKLVPFNAETVIGQAMEDAQGGKLDVSPSAQKDLMAPSASGGDNGAST